jgi:hypothetical protein
MPRVARFVVLFLTLSGLALWPARAGAQSRRPTHPFAYAVVVGSDPGGPGQELLAYAEKDAERVARILVELGGYDSRNVRLLLRPDARTVLSTLDALKQQIAAHDNRGQEARLVFYYSGHARANALNLGSFTLSLATLRERLIALPTRLTVVILDACQSGAFSRAKGASRAADFSYNSMTTLRTRGFAVMASSTEKELSQESDELKSSYFSHYLLVGLRGAGDHNRDGRVSLDEVYRYAYNHTLAATARTAVGGQHVTLETELMGHGEVPLSYPAAADSHVALRGDFDGRMLLQATPSGSVIAEVTKSKGAPLALAVPAGNYQATVRRGDKAWSCELSVRSNSAVTLDLGRCSAVADAGASTKGAAKAGEVWGFDLAIGGGIPRDDEYVERLEMFGYARRSDFLGLNPPCSPVYSVGVSRRVVRPLSVLMRFQRLDHCEYSRLHGADLPVSTDFSYTAYALDVGARAQLDIWGTWLSGYAQLEIGPALAETSFTDGTANPTGSATSQETHWGFHARAAAGLQIMPWRSLGLFSEAGYAYAPVIENELGDVHDSGGFTWFFGMHGRTWGTP